MSQELTPTPQTPIEKEASDSLLGLLKRYERSFKNVLPKQLTPDRFAWLCVNSIRTNPSLAGVTPGSFVNAVLLAANMGLEIRRNSAYLIPYKTECTLIVDYRGKMDLARRAGVKAMPVELVHEGDEFDFQQSNVSTRLVHKPLLWVKNNGKLVPVPDADRGEVVLGYAMARFAEDSEPQIELMSLDQIERIRKRARSGHAEVSLEEIRQKQYDPKSWPYKMQVPWLTDWNQMARKTLAHRICNYIPQTPELVLSQQIDDAESTGGKMPVASEMVNIEIDPADNKPMVAGDVDPEKIDNGDAMQEVRETKMVDIEAARDPQLKAMLDRIQKPADAGAVFQQIHQDMKELFGDQGSRTYADIMRRNGLEPSPSRVHVDVAKRAVAQLYSSLQLGRSMKGS